MAPFHRQLIQTAHPKAVLLHNGNNLKENYTSVKMLLSALKYVDYGWEGGHRRLQNGVIPYRPSRRFHEISLFPLPQGQYNENMMGYYIWGLLRESDLKYTRKSRKHNHF